MPKIKPMRLKRSNPFTAMTSKVRKITQLTHGPLHSMYWLFIHFDSVTSTKPHKFSISVRTEEYDPESESNGLACQLVFTYTEKYPDTAPLVEIEDPINFEDDFEEKLLEHVKETVCFACIAVGSQSGPVVCIVDILVVLLDCRLTKVWDWKWYFRWWAVHKNG